MNILIDMVHPADVHFFRYAIAELLAGGHNVAVTAREKDVTIELLQLYEIPFTILTKMGHSLGGLLFELILRDWRLWRFCRRFKPDVLTGISGFSAAHVGFLLRKPSVVWDDTEHQKLTHMITYPLANQYQCPSCYSKFLGSKQHFFDGIKELAYLDPKRFSPDADIVRSLGIDPDQKYCIIRLVSWGAHHDVGQAGLADEEKLSFVREIARYARPYITSEGPLPAELQQYQLKIPVHQIHHVLAFAALCIAEGATVAAEANVLGVPVVYVNTLRLGYIDMLESYGLLQQTTETSKALEYSLAWLNDPQAVEKCQAIRDKLLADKIDVTAHIVRTVEAAAEAAQKA